MKRGLQLGAAMLAVVLHLPAQEVAGVPPEWETRRLLSDLVSNARKLDPLMAEVKLAEWPDQDAARAYQAQFQSVKSSIAYLQWSSDRLAKDPTRMSLALDTLFHLQTFDAILNSFIIGVRRYQNPALAELLQSVANANEANRESLKQYALDLSKVKESEFNVMDAEAQRCRGMVLQAKPVARPKPVVKPAEVKKDKP